MIIMISNKSRTDLAFFLLWSYLVSVENVTSIPTNLKYVTPKWKTNSLLEYFEVLMLFHIVAGLIIDALNAEA